MSAHLSKLKFILAAIATTVLAGAAFGQSYKLESSATPVPQDLAAPVQSALSGNALHITGASGPLCEIWLAKAIQPAATPDTSLGVNFGQIAPGTLVGAVKFDAAGGDYRGQPIKPGVYTLRYMLQPVDGNHQGVSPYRDYVLAVPAALDTDGGVMTTDNLLKLSRKAAGTGHPSVWSLVPADSAPASLPAITHQADGDLWVVYFQASLPTPAKMGLVIVGRAPEQE
jgi:hypothetical protein